MFIWLRLKKNIQPKTISEALDQFIWSIIRLITHSTKEKLIRYPEFVTFFFLHSSKFKSRIIVRTDKKYIEKNLSNQQDTLRII